MLYVVSGMLYVVLTKYVVCCIRYVVCCIKNVIKNSWSKFKRNTFLINICILWHRILLIYKNFNFDFLGVDFVNFFGCTSVHHWRIIELDSLINTFYLKSCMANWTSRILTNNDEYESGLNIAGSSSIHSKKWTTCFKLMKTVLKNILLATLF